MISRLVDRLGIPRALLRALGGVALVLVPVVMVGSLPWTHQWWGGRLRDFWGDRASDHLALVQTMLVAVGGGWALYRYLLNRTGELTVRIALSGKVRVIDAQRFLFVRVHLANASRVAGREVDIVVVLFEVRPDLEGKGPPAHTPFSAQRACVALLGENDGIQFLPPERLSDIEPNECLEAEVVVPLADGSSELFAVRAEVDATQGRMVREDFNWAALSYFTVGELEGQADYVSLTSHADDGQSA